MKKMFGNLGLDNDMMGQIDDVAIAMMGDCAGSIAIPVEDKYFCFNKNNKKLTDVTGFTIDMPMPAYKVPVMSDTVAAGDTIVNNGKYMFVTSVSKTGIIKGIDPISSSEVNVVPISNPIFGDKKLIAKVQTMDMALNLGGAAADNSNPMANMMSNPMMMMLMMGDDDEDNSGGMGKMMEMMMMQQMMGGGGGLFGKTAE